jgi:hypothetical protein
MKNYEQYVYTPGYEWIHYVGGSDIAFYTTQNRHASYHKVVSGPIVYGNHHDANSWSYNVTHIKNWVGHYTKHFPPQPWETRPEIVYEEYNNFAWNDGPGAPSGNSQAVYNQALSRLNSAVRGGVDLGVSLAEAGQTIRMLRALADVRRYANVSGFGSGRDLANGWLEWQYGWRPLMNDVFGAAEEAFNIVLKVIKTFRASAIQPLSGLGNIERFIGENSWHVTSKGSGKQACRFVVTLELPGATLDRWSTLNPVGLAWELIPYSFVVDWFYDVGSFLRNAETALLYDTRFVSGYVSQLYVYDGTEEAYGGQRIPPGSGFISTNPPKFNTCEGIKSSLKVRNFSRTKLSSYPLPHAPSFRCDLGSQQLLSLAALLAQLL